MNQLFDENTAGAPKDQISKTLKSLAETTIKHFQDEEAFMQRVEFPQFDVHKAIHVDLLTKFKGHMDAYLNGSESRLAPGFFEFLRMWLQAHIQHVDRKYGEHAKVHKRAA
jgi:hemerythrin-like metal-binding protein